MLQFISLGSGSSGNSYFLLADGFGLVIDLGIGIRIFKRSFRNYGLTLPSVKALLLTHDHTDHVKAAGALSAEMGIPVYASPEVHASIIANHHVAKKVPKELRRETSVEEAFEIGPFKIEAFKVPHDSADNQGYVIRYGQTVFVLLTDVGHFTEEAARAVRQANHLVVESNYDPQMLREGRYPARLKARISGGRGHVSNKETADFLSANLDPALIRNIWLCHLSAENNRAEIAARTVREALTEVGIVTGTPDSPTRLEALPRRTPSLLQTLEE